MLLLLPPHIPSTVLDLGMNETIQCVVPSCTSEWWHHISSIFYPRLCVMCVRACVYVNERVCLLSCVDKSPITINNVKSFLVWYPLISLRWFANPKEGPIFSAQTHASALRCKHAHMHADTHTHKHNLHRPTTVMSATGWGLEFPAISVVFIEECVASSQEKILS